MYECVKVKVTWEQDNVLEAKGPLDDESDCEDGDVREYAPQRHSDSSQSNTSSMGAEARSLMNIENLQSILAVRTYGHFEIT
jgi:hypothetical protein